MDVNVVKLGDVAIISAGQSAPKSNYFGEEGTPFIRAGSLEFLERGESIDLCEKINKENAKICKLKLYPVNSILFAKSGMSANKGRIYKLKQEAYIVSHLAIVTTNETKLFSEYLMYWLQKHPPKTLIKDDSYPSIGLTDIANMEIELPSLEKQKQIAQILDKADEIRQKKKQANEKLDEFLKSTFIDMFGDPVRNNKEFSIVNIGKMTTLVSSGSTPLGGSSVYQDKGVLFIRSQNVLMNKFDFTDIAHISDEIYNSMERTKVQINDVLLNITGASIGRIHRYMFNNKANVNQHVCIIRPILNKVSPVYLEYCIGNSHYQHNILKQNSGATRQAFNFEQIKGFRIPLPPIEQQNKFAQIVEKVEAQKQKNEQVIAQMDNLFNALSQKVFKGEL